MNNSIQIDMVINSNYIHYKVCFGINFFQVSINDKSGLENIQLILQVFSILISFYIGVGFWKTHVGTELCSYYYFLFLQSGQFRFHIIVLNFCVKISPFCFAKSHWHDYYGSYISQTYICIHNECHQQAGRK